MDSSTPLPVPSQPIVPPSSAPPAGVHPGVPQFATEPGLAAAPAGTPIAIPDAAGVITLTPSASAYWKRLAVPAIVVGALAVVRSLYVQNPVLLIAAYVITFAVAAGVSAIYLARARVVIAPDRVGKRGLFGYRWVDRATLGRLLVARGYGQSMTFTGARTDAFLFDTYGKRVMRLTGQIWDETRVQTFHAALALPTRVRQAPTKPKDLRREEPKALSWSEANPGASIVVTFCIVVAVIVLLAVVGAALSR